VEFFRKTLDPVIALAAIALLDIFLFLQLGAWTVGGGETMMTGLIAEFFMGDEIRRIPFWQLVFEPDAGYWKIYISLGMLFGAVLGAVVRQGLGTAAVGLCIGVLAAMATTRLFAGPLFGTSADSAAVTALVTALVFATVLVACWLPARLALRVDPVRALRAD